MHSYQREAERKAKAILEGGRANLLAIESSCDETAAAVMDKQGNLLANVIATQIDTHALYGGVVPEIASRQHLEAMPHVVRQALQQANMTWEEIDCVAVTCGPGLMGALLCGVSYAKALAYALQVPLVGVNHIEGHMYANAITHRDLKPPYICLIVSGGHTHLLHVPEEGAYYVLGRTCDDAAGEAFDKVARAIGLPYPGGPNIDRLAKEGNPKAYTFTRPKTKNPYDFSFSGMKTAVMHYVQTAKQQGEEVVPADMAASFQSAAVDFLLKNAFAACRDKACTQLVLCGGVCANKGLREEALKRGKKLGVRVYMPDTLLCTDNAAMIAAAAYKRLHKGNISDMDLKAEPNLPLPVLQEMQADQSL